MPLTNTVPASIRRAISLAPVEVARPDGGAEAVLGVVGELDGVVDVAGAQRAPRPARTSPRGRPACASVTPSRTVGA